jgi:hypothetical protein
VSGKAPKAKISDADRANAEISAHKWNDWVTRYAAVQDRLIEMTNDTGRAHARAVGEASAEATMAAGLETGNIQKQMQTGSKTAGVSPLGDVMERASMARRGLGSAYGVIEPAVKERQIRGRLKVVAATRGVADQANLGMAELGRMSTNAAMQDLQRSSDMRAGLLNAAGTAAGSYTAYRMYGPQRAPAPIIDRSTFAPR